MAEEKVEAIKVTKEGNPVHKKVTTKTVVQDDIPVGTEVETSYETPTPQPPEKIVTRVKIIHNVHPTGSGLLNALVALECGGIALLQSIVSITGGQSVSVLPDQIVGAITEDHVLKAYTQGFEKGTQEKDKPKSVKIKRKIEAAKEIEAELKDKK